MASVSKTQPVALVGAPFGFTYEVAAKNGTTGAVDWSTVPKSCRFRLAGATASEATRAIRAAVCPSCSKCLRELKFSYQGEYYLRAVASKTSQYQASCASEEVKLYISCSPAALSCF